MNGKKVYQDYIKKKHEYDLAEVKIGRLIQSFKIKYNIEEKIGGIEKLYIGIDDYGFLIVQITEDKYRDTWEIQFHENFCEEFDVKLIKTEHLSQFRSENGYVSDKLRLCEYTYAPRDNKDFEEIKHLHLC